MKRFLVSLMVIMLMLSLVACGGTQIELTNTGNYENMTLELLDASVIMSEDGRQLIEVKANYQNNNADGLYAYCSFVVKAFQNNVELTDVSDINGNEAVLIQEVKAGESLSVHYLFEINDNSGVEVQICTPTAEQNVIAKKIYSGNTNSSADKTEDATTYADEWKANKVVGNMGNVKSYETYIIKLNSDGTGSYQEKAGTWEHDQENNQIVLTLTDESIGMVLKINEEEGNTVLTYYEDTYYRASEFVENVNE